MPAPKKTRTNQPTNQATPSSSKDNSGWALKKLDGEMFTRADIQYDLMSNIFNDRTFQFTSPLDQRAISFKELYVETLSRFSKAAKSTVRQLDDNPNVMGYQLCIASFLINIGRINTTVAFYPELRAYMRTYHPIPCLQKDEYCQTNLQDAPRIKTMLKSCQLPSEFNNEPDSLPEIAKRSALGYRPPTTVVNLIFDCLASNLMKYFPDGFVLHDLFSPTTIPTKLRAYAFLWLMHHFLEDPSSMNDFQHESKVEAFQLARLEDIQPDSSLGDAPENVDTEEEIQWGKDMQLIEKTQLTKKQKIMVQNYAQSAIEGEEGQMLQSQLAKGTTPGSSIPPSALIGSAKFENRKGTVKILLRENALDAMAKYGDDHDLDAPEDSLTTTQLAWRRYQTDLSEDFDVAYDSDDQIRQPFPAWKPKELTSAVGLRVSGDDIERILRSEEEQKDKVIRYIGAKRRAQATATTTSNLTATIEPKGGVNELKRKRKANPSASNTTATQPPITGPIATEPNPSLAQGEGLCIPTRDPQLDTLSKTILGSHTLKMTPDLNHSTLLSTLLIGFLVSTAAHIPSNSHSSPTNSTTTIKIVPPLPRREFISLSPNQAIKLRTHSLQIGTLINPDNHPDPTLRGLPIGLQEYFAPISQWRPSSTGLTDLAYLRERIKPKGEFNDGFDVGDQ
ncbi:hypothetical protein H4Q26_004989 [Puccinia striiformis f. sp. tritici PST-130]|nr:hypothetical protein H4Q26_004989 [Puccinia striiformis f. sp. tritici PST-130]